MNTADIKFHAERIAKANTIDVPKGHAITQTDIKVLAELIASLSDIVANLQAEVRQLATANEPRHPLKD